MAQASIRTAAGIGSVLPARHADEARVGRSNVIIAVLGLAACLCLSLIMKSALKLSSEKQIPQVVRELSARYGSQLEGSPKFWMEATPEGRFAYLEVVPLLNSGGDRLALSLGHYLWRGLEGVENLLGIVVDCRFADGRQERYQVRAPRQPGRSIRRLSAGEVPSPGPTPEPPPAPQVEVEVEKGGDPAPGKTP